MNRGILLSFCALVAIGPSVSGCGGSSYHPPESCLKAAPCGGDVVGTWNFLGGCSDLAAANAEIQASCPGSSISALVTTFSGTLTFNADLTYTTGAWRQVVSAVENIPASCIGTTSCSSLSGTTRDQMSSTVISCSGTSVCACRFSGSASIAAETGTYSLYNTALSMLGTNTSGSFDYCVAGDELHLMQLSTTTGGVLSDLVAQRKTP